MARAQMVDAYVQGCQRTGARRIDRQVCAAEVQPVGHPACSHVAKNTGKRVLVPFRKLFLKRSYDVLPVLLRNTLNTGQIMHQHGTEHIADSQIVRASGSEDNRRAFSGERKPIKTGVFQCLTGHFQGQQLHRFDRTQAGGRNAVSEGVKLDVVNKTAPFGIRLVRGHAVRIEEVRRPPAIVAHLADGIHAFYRILPESADILCSGENTCHADYRNIFVIFTPVGLFR